MNCYFPRKNMIHSDNMLQEIKVGIWIFIFPLFQNGIQWELYYTPIICLSTLCLKQSRKRIIFVSQTQCHPTIKTWTNSLWWQAKEEAQNIEMSRSQVVISQRKLRIHRWNIKKQNGNIGRGILNFWLFHLFRKLKQ